MPDEEPKRIMEEYDLAKKICIDYNGIDYFDNIVSIFHEIKFA